MNCLMQKSLKDKVFVNGCNLDSVLWFHLECPRASGQFDDPIEFKKKFRDYFANMKSVRDSIKENETQKRVRREYGFQTSYPEYIKYHARAMKIANELKDQAPDRRLIDMLYNYW